MENIFPISEGSNNYLSSRIKETKDRLLVAEQKVQHIKLELNTLKQQELAMKGLSKNLREDIRAAFRITL